MRFLLHHLESVTKDEVARGNEFDAYFEYLASVKDQLPASAYSFASAPWHYDFSDHRCPHDSWLDSLSVIEVASGNRKQDRSVVINVRLLGAYHDGYVEMTYQAVDNYSLAKPARTSMNSLNVGHGDWLMDEVRVSDRGLVIHEIDFSTGSRWLVECKDIEHQWNAL